MGKTRKKAPPDLGRQSANNIDWQPRADELYRLRLITKLQARGHRTWHDKWETETA
jgi:hypothetical protein